MKKISFTILISFISLLTGCSSETNNKFEENNKIDGFSIPLPNNWVDKSQLDIKDNLSSFDFNDDEITKILKSHNGSIPIVIYMKYDPDTAVAGVPIPTIQVNLRPNNSRDFNDFKKVMQNSILEFNDYFSNFKLIEPLGEVEIDGIKGVRFIFEFELPIQQGEIWKIRSWTYGFPSGKYFYQINFSDMEDENCEDLYNELINQVKFSK
jgi:hypothetical protein